MFKGSATGASDDAKTVFATSHFFVSTSSQRASLFLSATDGAARIYYSYHLMPRPGFELTSVEFTETRDLWRTLYQLSYRAATIHWHFNSSGSSSDDAKIVLRPSGPPKVLIGSSKHIIKTFCVPSPLTQKLVFASSVDPPVEPIGLFSKTQLRRGPGSTDTRGI